MHRLSVVLSAAILLTACGRAAPAPADAGRAPEPPRAVVVATAVSAPFPRTVLLQGTLEAEHTVQLAAPVEGAVLTVGADLGDPVRRGQTLARIDVSAARARLADAVSALATAREDLARYEGVDPVDAVSRQQVATARARVTSAEHAVELARVAVDDARVVAPWEGAVMKRYVERGAYVRPGAALFDLVSTGPLRLALEVPEDHIATVGVGATLHVLPGESAEPRFEATVARVAPAVSPATRTFRLEARVDPQGGRLRAGMFVVAVLELGREEAAVRVPRAAVVSVLGRDRVAVVEGGRARPVEVELLGEHDGHAFVLGLPVGSVVVARGAGTLAPDAPVRVESGGAAAPTGSGAPTGAPAGSGAPTAAPTGAGR